MIAEPIDAGVRWAGSLRPPRWSRWLRGAALALSMVAASVLVAALVVAGLWYVVVGALLSVPAVVALHRRPMLGVSLWILVGPLIAVSDDDGARKFYWIFHRGLPLLTVLIIVVASAVGLRERRLPRLTLAEALMAAYVVASTVSLLFTAESPLATTYLLYDRVIAPMCMYLVVRLTDLEERDLRLLLPSLLFLLVSQSVIGALSWIAPGILPAEWLTNVGRTSGSLRDPDLFAVSGMFAALFILHVGLRSARSRWVKAGMLLLLVDALYMAFLSYERAAWLAALLVVGTLLYLFRRHAVKVVPVAGLLVVVLLASGVLNGPLSYAESRLHSPEADEAALSRLPPALAAVRMFTVKPITGWGYNTFDRFSLPFQGRIGDLVYPRKIHASHNVYLTLVAEQGIVGFVLFLGPVVYWLASTPAAVKRLRSRGALGTRFLAVCWLGVLTHVVINNFVNMRVTFGLGMWWLMLGLIAATIERGRRGAPGADVSRPVALARGAA